VPASDRAACDAWFSLGFGHDATLAVRETDAPVRPAPDVDIQRATAADLDAVVGMALALYEHHARAPMYLPFLAEVEPDARAEIERALADADHALWITRRDGRAIGLYAFEPPPPWISPLLRPKRSTYLLQGYTEPRCAAPGRPRAPRPLARMGARGRLRLLSPALPRRERDRGALLARRRVPARRGRLGATSTSASPGLAGVNDEPPARDLA
jgi:hypothetical protein